MAGLGRHRNRQLPLVTGQLGIQIGITEGTLHKGWHDLHLLPEKKRIERWRAPTIAIQTIARNPTLKPSTALKTTHHPSNRRTGSPRNRHPQQTTHSNN
jgi:hypothetical protein